MSKENQVPEWIKKRHQEHEQKAKAIQKYKEGFLKLPVGESKVLIDTTIPVEEVEKYGKTKYRYIVEYQGKKLKWDVSSVMDTDITALLVQNVNPITVVRIGTTKDNTKYSVKA